MLKYFKWGEKKKKKSDDSFFPSIKLSEEKIWKQLRTLQIRDENESLNRVRYDLSDWPVDNELCKTGRVNNQQVKCNFGICYICICVRKVQ